MSDYFVIDSRSGETHIMKCNKKELLAVIREEMENNAGSDRGSLSFITDCIMKEAGTDPMYWGNRLCIIQGKLVEPRPVKEVTVWDV